MGQFNVNVTAVGGHGDSRDVGDGGTLDPTTMGGIDLLCHQFVEELEALGASVESAVLTHWPGQTSQVVDDLVTKKRTGSF